MSTMDKEATSRVQMAALEAAREEERRLQTERVEAQRAAEAAQPPQPRPARSRLEEIVTNPGSVAGFIGLSPAAVRELIAKNVIPSCSAVEDSGGHTLIPVGLFKRWMDLGMPMHDNAADDVRKSLIEGVVPDMPKKASGTKKKTSKEAANGTE